MRAAGQRPPLADIEPLRSVSRSAPSRMAVSPAMADVCPCRETFNLDHDVAQDRAELRQT